MAATVGTAGAVAEAVGEAEEISRISHIALLIVGDVVTSVGISAVAVAVIAVVVIAVVETSGDAAEEWAVVVLRALEFSSQS
jgi:hypothetical protein